MAGTEVGDNCRFCTSRVEAIKYLMQDKTAKGELAKMKKGLLADGWMTDPNLPKVFYLRTSVCRSGSCRTDPDFLAESGLITCPVK
jgi:hypothetical protein